MSYISHRLYVFKITALSGGIFQQTTALNNALALWVLAFWHTPCISAVNICFSIRHAIFLTQLCRLFTKRITTTRLKLLLSQYRRESSLLPQCNLPSPARTHFTWNITSLLKIKGYSESMLYSRTASVGNMPLCVTAEKWQTFGTKLSGKTVI